MHIRLAANHLQIAHRQNKFINQNIINWCELFLIAWVMCLEFGQDINNLQSPVLVACSK